MKITFLTNFFPPKETGGTENYTYALAREFIRQGHEARVACAGHWDSGRHYWNGYVDEVYSDVPIRRMNFNWRKAPDPNRFLYDNPLAAALVSDHLHECRPDVVHITSCNTLSARAIDVARAANLPVVLTLTDFAFLCPRLTLLRKDGHLCTGQTSAWECLECMLLGTKAYKYSTHLLPYSAARKLLIRVSEHAWLNRKPGFRGQAINMSQRKVYLANQIQKVDLVLVPSHFLAATCRSAGLDRDFRIQPHGHDVGMLNFSSRANVNGHLRLGYLGNVLPIKGVEVLVQAIMKLRDEFRLSLDIWGDNSRAPEYVGHLHELTGNSTQVRFRGSYDRAQLPTILAGLDVVVTPSLCYENNPLVIQEAFAAGLPVVATNVGGMAESVRNEVDGLLFGWGDVDDLARQLSRLANEPGLLERLQSNIRPVKTIAQEANELLGLYEELIRSNASAATDDV